MSQKVVDVPGIGEVLLAKRRGSKSLRLSLLPDGRVRVGLPNWLPYSAGIRFALSRSDWINQHQPDHLAPLLREGDLIGKSYRLNFISQTGAQKTTTRLGSNKILIKSASSYSHADVQRMAIKASEKALKIEATTLLPQRLEKLAEANNFIYKKVIIKRLTSRWGSCSSQNTITLSYYLVQLPWRLIDYVIVHELIHTQYLDHSKNFWAAFEQVMPNAKELRKEMKQFRPTVLPN